MEIWESDSRARLDQNQVSTYTVERKQLHYKLVNGSYNTINAGYLPQQGRLLILMIICGYLHVPATSLLSSAVGARSWHLHTFKGVF
jgi:hypothetical protein